VLVLGGRDGQRGRAGTARALGEVEALESLGIDPIHYLVMPRVIGLAVAVFCLTTYLVAITFGCGWLFAFVQDVPLTMASYFGQISRALRWRILCCSR